MTDPNAVASLVGVIAWPTLIGIAYVVNRNVISSLLQAAAARIQRGDEVAIGFVKIGQAVGPLSPPQVGEEITDDHLALIHRSWRVPKRDHEFNGQKMYQMHVIVFGTEAAIKQIDYVVYRLDKSYPCSVQVVSSKRKNFELKELANGYSLIRAEVYIRDQPKVVRLSRFIDLTDASPPLSLPIYRQPD